MVDRKGKQRAMVPRALLARGVSMLSEDAWVGRRVRICEDHRKTVWRGRDGTIVKRWGDPDYVALDVRLDDGAWQLFWHHELERVPEHEPAALHEKAGA